MRWESKTATIISVAVRASWALEIGWPHLLYVGGLSRALRVARMAASPKLPCLPHCANLAMVTVCTLHMFGAIPNAGDHVEFTIESNDWGTDL